VALPAGSLDALGGGNATNGAALRYDPVLTLSLPGYLKFDWSFSGGDDFSADFRDFAFLEVDDSAQIIRQFDGSTGGGSGTFAKFLGAGPHNFSVGSMNFGDLLVDATLVVDNFRVSTTAGDPVLLDLDGDGVELVSLADGVTFDLNGDGVSDRMGWAGADDGLLVADADGSGAIEDGSEVFSPFFGDGSFGSSLEALASFDGNGDGLLDAADAGFFEVMVWRDTNRNGVSDTGELASLAEVGVAAIDLGASPSAEVVEGQGVVRTGTVHWGDGSTAAYGEAYLDVEFMLSGPGTLTPNVEGPTVISGTAGNDLLAGTQGNDLFLFEGIDGADRITGFEAGEASDDVLVLRNLGLGDFAAVQAAASQVGPDTLIDLGSGDQISLAGVSLTELHPDDFLFG
jgi:hypothetical protein